MAKLHDSPGRFTFPVAAGIQDPPAQTVFSRRWLPLTIAACLSLAALFLWRYAPARSTARGSPIGTILNPSSAVLLANERPAQTAVGSPLRSGALHRRSGLLALPYPCGVVLVLESPSRFELRSATTLWLPRATPAPTFPPRRAASRLKHPAPRSPMSAPSGA
jgi:hypothetical protein